MSGLVPLDTDAFAAFFEEVYHYPPFPWQRRLAAQVGRTGHWPDALDLPTGSGKTAVLDIAVFQLALEADRAAERRAPVRMVLVVDRRLVVDDAFARAQMLAAALHAAPCESIAWRVAARLRHLAGDGPPLLVRRLRGGIPHEDDWARTPSQPTILCSTVDQVGSRLLFRGYGVSDRAKPIHAGLLGADCRIFLDEAHLAEPFRQTLTWVQHYRGERWQMVPGAPWGVSLLTATRRGASAVGACSRSAGPDAAANTVARRGPSEARRTEDVLCLQAEDYANPVLYRRLNAAKPAHLVTLEPVRPIKTAAPDGAVAESDEPARQRANETRRVAALAAEVERGLATLREGGLATPALGVVVNRVARAREVFERVRACSQPEGVDVILLIGPARPVDRDRVADTLGPIRTGGDRRLDRPLVVVATQCIEAGVDIDLDGLITEAAPVDALRQRFGRLNRDGRPIVPFAVVLAAKSDLAARYEDPVYGRSVQAAWAYLTANEATSVDFGVSGVEALNRERAIPPEACSVGADAPVLMSAHLDLLSQTAPVPSSDPDVALYLHGPQRQPSSISVVWRADIGQWGWSDAPQAADAMTRRLLTLVPPRTTEAIQLPVWTVRAWLKGEGGGGGALADVPAGPPDAGTAPRPTAAARTRRAFRWVGDDERSVWIDPTEIRPGDTLVVPSAYGGADEYGWNQRDSDPTGSEESAGVTDVADRAAEPFAAIRFTVRVAPGLLAEALPPVLGESLTVRHEKVQQERRAAEARSERLADILADTPRGGWRALRDAIQEIGLPEAMSLALARLDQARGARARVEVYADLYGTRHDRPVGVVFVAPLGLGAVAPQGGGATSPDARLRTGEGEAAPPSTEDDATGSMAGFTESLDAHSAAVETLAEAFARGAGLSEPLIADLRLAGALHDAGKADGRFQSLLASGDPLGPDPERLLAKSGRRVPRGVRERTGLPLRWRHEALSVRLAPLDIRFAAARGQVPGHDLELVLWLIGTHHGWGRPFFPHTDPLDGTERRVSALTLPPGPGPQSLAYDWAGLDWPGLYACLKTRYGLWDLARMEAILRLADHRASQVAQRAAAGGSAR